MTPSGCSAASGSRSMHPACGGRLDADDRHVVGDDVVQLAGDAQPLVDDGLPVQGVAWAWMVRACSASSAFWRA